MATNWEEITYSPVRLVDILVPWKERCALAFLRERTVNNGDCVTCLHYGECDGSTTHEQQHEWAVEWLQEEASD